jgi:hypothetical protein
MEECEYPTQLSHFQIFFLKKQGSLGFVGRSVLILEFFFRVIVTLFLSSAVSKIKNGGRYGG